MVVWFSDGLENVKPRHQSIYVPLDMIGCICHFTKWQIHPFISKGTNYVFDSAHIMETDFIYNGVRKKLHNNTFIAKISRIPSEISLFPSKNYLLQYFYFLDIINTKR